MLTSCQILILVVLKLLLPYQESRAISFRIKIQRKSGQSKFLIYSCVSCLTRSLSLVAMPLIFHDTCDIYKRTAAQIVTNLRDLHPFASSMIGNIKLTTDNSAEWLGAKEGVFISYEFLIIRFDLSHQHLRLSISTLVQQVKHEGPSSTGSAAKTHGLHMGGVATGWWNGWDIQEGCFWPDTICRKCQKCPLQKISTVHSKMLVLHF